jgi:hypothetical protein
MWMKWFFQCGAAIGNRKEPSQVIRAVLRFLLNHGLQKKFSKPGYDIFI